MVDRNPGSVVFDGNPSGGLPTAIEVPLGRNPEPENANFEGRTAGNGTPPKGRVDTSPRMAQCPDLPGLSMAERTCDVASDQGVARGRELRQKPGYRSI